MTADKGTKVLFKYNSDSMTMLVIRERLTHTQLSGLVTALPSNKDYYTQI